MEEHAAAGLRRRRPPRPRVEGVARGTDGDLKCILRGIAQDLPVRLKEVETASDQRARDMALKEMFWLLRDNVEVITAPPAAPV